MPYIEVQVDIDDLIDALDGHEDEVLGTALRNVPWHQVCRELAPFVEDAVDLQILVDAILGHSSFTKSDFLKALDVKPKKAAKKKGVRKA